MLTHWPYPFMANGVFIPTDKYYNQLMKSIVRLTVLIILSIGIYQPIYAGDYTLRKGQSMKLNCTATPPAGTITHAFFQVVNAGDSEYLGINYNSWECQATLYGLKAKSKIPVEVTYAYSYRGSYDNNMHVGHGSYIDYVTVTGPKEAKSIKIKEGGKVKIAPGTSKTLHIEFYPSGSEGQVDWGFLSGFGKPYNFEGKYASNGIDFIVTGKKEGTAYLLALLNGDQTTVQSIEVECTQDADADVLPESISVSPEKLSLPVGSSQQLNISFSPEDSYATAEWTSSDETIATVNEGKVEAVSKGDAIITVTTSNGLSVKIPVNVIPLADNFDISGYADLILGYTYQLTPKAYPEGSYCIYRYKSSDTSVVRVSSDGLLTAVKEGEARITVTSTTTNTERDVFVNVKHSGPEIDYRAARARIQAVKALFNQSIIAE